MIKNIDKTDKVILQISEKTSGLKYKIFKPWESNNTLSKRVLNSWSTINSVIVEATTSNSN
jgi:hypothetical protein